MTLTVVPENIVHIVVVLELRFPEAVQFDCENLCKGLSDLNVSSFCAYQLAHFLQAALHTD
jgi:hypothetical protein